MQEDLLQSDRESESYQPDSSPAKTVGLFFGIVILAGVCFGLGYHFGKQAAPPVTIVNEPALSNSNVPKPSAARSADAPTVESEAAPPSAAPQSSSDNAKPSTSTPVEIAHAAANGNFAVQVAAVSKEEDADALVSALRKKNYPVFVVNNQGDKFFHVQVGPFASQADAESMRARLSSDGYNPILKK